MNPHQCDPRKVVALGDHLGADEDVRLLFGNFFRISSCFLLAVVSSPCGPPGPWGIELSLFLDLFGSQPHLVHIPSLQVGNAAPGPASRSSGREAVGVDPPPRW